MIPGAEVSCGCRATPNCDLPLRRQVQTMNSGRKEKRSAKKLAVQLSNDTVVAEYASTENVSAKGARIRTVRPWKLDTRVLVKSTWYELRTQARVVYCQALPDTTFAVGLELLTPPDAWLRQ